MVILTGKHSPVWRGSTDQRTGWMHSKEQDALWLDGDETEALRISSTSGHSSQPFLILETKASGKTRRTHASQDPNMKRHTPIS